MLTIFATCKPFRGHNAVIQRNAIQSWTRLGSDVEVLLMGDDPGVREVAAEFGVRHMPDIACNEYGTPLLSAMFELAQHVASNDTLCYVNADIILLDDFLGAVRQPKLHGWKRYLLISPRWELDIEAELDFAGDWQSDLRLRVAQAGVLHAGGGIDYFVFNKGLYQAMPPYAVGRMGFDHWLIYAARDLAVPVIDARSVVTVVHQNHDFSHHPEGIKGVRYESVEGRANQQLAPTWITRFNHADATWDLTPRGIRPVMSPLRLFRIARGEAMLRPWLRLPLTPVRAALRPVVDGARLLRAVVGPPGAP